MVARVLEGLDDDLLHARDEGQCRLRGGFFHQRATVEPHGLRHVVGAILHEAHQPRQVHFTVLRGQELFQFVIA